MSRNNNNNIKIGIDLGTTNSAVALNEGGEINIVKNVLGDAYTPSVFGIDKSGNKIVGKRAYEKLYRSGSEEEHKNNIAEIKRKMGTGEKIDLPRVDQEFTPEEISAEILKSLKEDILRKYSDFDTRSAVITVPAHFSTLQAEATKRAGDLAGFNHVVLLQEPIAAAIAYGFMGSENENWLVYDLGGGTFDVALISSQGGALSVLNHHGDNFLGGKDIDWQIVEEIIVPAINNEYELKGFKRSNQDGYRTEFAKLKFIAENAKIYLSQYESTTMEIDGIGKDENGEEIQMAVELDRSELEKLIKPIVDKTLELTKETIKDAGVDKSSINKLVLVGGSTQTPYIQDRLNRELQMEIDSSLDPLTVVARGACIFAKSQRIPEEALEETGEEQEKSDAAQISLNYDSLTSETEEAISGTVEGLEGDPTDYSIQIQSESGYYSRSKVSLREGGKFFDTVALEANKENLYWIYLFDDKGNSIEVEPESFSITHGLTISEGAPIPHSIGVAVAKRDMEGDFNLKEEFDVFFEKGSNLPLEETKTYQTIRRAQKGEEENIFPIKVYEGESEKPGQNYFVCSIEVTGKDIPHDLPRGTDIDLTLSVNESREVSVEAYIPTIDLSLDARATVHDEDVDVAEIKDEMSKLEKRVGEVSEGATNRQEQRLQQELSTLKSSIRNARTDSDEKRKAQKQIKDLKTKIDEVEREKEFPELKKEFNQLLSDAEDVIDSLDEEEEQERFKEQLNALQSEGEEAISEKDKSQLQQVIERMRDLGMKAVFANPATWVYQFNQLTDGTKEFVDEQEAKKYISKGKKAIELNDIDELKRCVRELMLLLPQQGQEEVMSGVSWITYKDHE